MARGLLVFLLIMAVETVHGVLRGLFLAPRVGEEMAGRIGWPVALVLVLLIAWATIRWIGLRGTRPLVALVAAWAVLTIAFEVMIGMLRGMGMPEIMAELNPLTGTIPYSAAVMLIAPWAAARLRGLV
jgi:predicted anti-sigma-YlaC factor YlaD